EGSVIVVSHDRFFLNRITDMLLVLDDGRVLVIHGNYDTYERMRATSIDTIPASNRQETKPAPVEERSERAGKSNRKRRFPYRKVGDLEAEIAQHETRLREVEALLASAELYRDGDKVKEAMRSFEDLKAALAGLYEHWEEAVELN